MEFPVTRLTVTFEYMIIKISRLYHIESSMDDLSLSDSSFILHLQTHIIFKETYIGSTITVENSDWNFWFTMETYVFEDVLQLGQGSNELPFYQYINQEIIDKLIIKREEWQQSR